ncbi:MAG: ABC transporter permease [Acidimicrobiales bacterium]|nr:ABC transporter permease [Acidimicrobiales bacterium]MCB1013690.1 ABC transporter permease [Acidimicrobiales bacterium]MCB9371721.1 ABC transporter permease [Microthrixaceae bacterium]
MSVPAPLLAAGDSDPGLWSEFWSYLTTADNWTGDRGIAALLVAHVQISVVAVLLAAAVAIVPAVLLGHTRRGAFLAVSVVNIGRALPSFAIIALVLPVSLEWGLGLGFWPTCVALVLLAVPPMFTNAYTGVRDVDPGTVEAAVGMGMTPTRVVTRVEVPNASPLIITGVRVSAVQVVATATLGALVGFSCLGSLIVEGFAQQNDGKLLTGAFLVAVLSLVTEAFFSLVQRLATPWLRAPRRRARPARSDPPAVALDA